MAEMAEVSSPVAKRRKRLSLKRKSKAGSTEIEDEIDEERFVSPSKSLATYQVGFVPKNTSVNTKWAVKNFTDWKDSYNARHPDELCPEDILLCDSPSDLSLWLSLYSQRFIECRLLFEWQEFRTPRWYGA